MLSVAGKFIFDYRTTLILELPLVHRRCCPMARFQPDAFPLSG